MTQLEVEIVLYHGKCADGIGAAWPFWRENRDAGTNIQFQGCLRDQPPPDVKGKRVAILDFCYGLKETLNLAKSAISIIIIDHHETAKDLIGKVPKNVELIIDMTKSGAQLGWEYMYSDPCPWMLNVIAARDLWKWDVDPRYRHLSDVLYKRGYYSFQKLEELYVRTFQEGEETVIEEFMGLDGLDAKGMQQAIKAAMKSAFITTYTSPEGETYKVRLATCDRKLRSEIGNSLSENVDFALIYSYDFLLNQWWCAARSNEANDIDLARITAQHGGGGHKKAASFVIDGNKGESLHTYFKILEIPPHREIDAKKYGIKI